MSSTTGTPHGEPRLRGNGLPATNAQLLVVLGALVLTALLYWPTSLEIADFWQDTARRRYTHGWAVLAVTVWLIWRQRGALRDIPLRPVPGGWLLVVAGSVAWLIAFHAALLVPTMLVLPALALSAVFAVGGWRLARQVAFPVLFLYFALPVWDVIDLPLQTLTAKLSLWLVQLVGIPATTDGHVIHIPTGWFEIAASCNGLHFLIVALAIAAVHGHVDGDDWGSRLMLLVLAAGLAVLTNLSRVFVVIVAGHLTDMQHFLVQVDHYYFGWVLFALTLILYVWLSSSMPRRSRADRSAKEPPEFESERRTAPAAGLVVAALVLGPVWSFVSASMFANPVPLHPPAIPGWTGPVATTAGWQPVFASADEEFLVTYRRATSDEFSLYRAAYHRQHQDKELLGFGNSIVGDGFRVQEERARDTSAGRHQVPMREHLLVSASGHERLVWSVLAVDGHPDPMSLTSRLAYGIRALVGNPTVSVVAVSGDCEPDCEHARDVLKAAAAAVLPTLLPASVDPAASAH